MAITKWIPFGAPQPTAAASETTKLPQKVVVTPADGKRFGLENFGNICYANSVLQALYFCSPFRELVLQCPDPSLLLPQKSAPAVTTTTPVIPAPLQSNPPMRRRPERRGTSESIHTNGTAQPLPPGPPIPPAPATLFSALRSLFLHISQNPADKGTVAPRAFIEKLKDVNTEFRNTNHQDAHEFLNFLLNKIVEEMEEERKHQVITPSGEDLSNSVGTLVSPTIITATASSNSGTSAQDATLVHKLFEGVLTSETRCLTCETVSSRDESFLDLSIDIEQNSSVTACLRQFSASEMLCQKNKFFCDSCCDLQEAEKRMKIKKLPNVLALHLKRFKYQEDVQKYIKLAYRVAFPFELRLFNTVDDAPDPDRLFELFAIVVHIGNGPHHGHYVTIIRTPATWLVFDDDTVEPIKESEISKYFGESNSGSAYVLYYQAVDLDLAALGLRSTTPPVPEPASVDVPTQKRQSFEPPASPVTVPSLPPGLADEVDSSDVSDPPFPVTPSQYSHPPVVNFLDRTPHRSPSVQPLKVNISSPEDVNASFSGTSDSPVIPTPSGKSGLFQSLRHSPSIKIRGQAIGSSATTKRRSSVKENITRPATAPGLQKPDGPSEPPPLSTFPPTPAPPSPVHNGPATPDPPKIKEPERKASTWFKRKSGRADKRPETSSGSPTKPFYDGDVSSPPSSSTAWFRSSPAADPSKRRPSEPSLFDAGGFRKSDSPKPSADLTLTSQNGTGDHRSGYDTPSPGSASSSFASTSAAALPADSHSPVRNSHPLPSIPASPQGPSIRQPIYAPSPAFSPRASVDHKRSQPHLKITKSAGYDSPSSPKALPRPSTAGATTVAKVRSEPEPPLPPLPPSSKTHRRGGSNDQASDTTATTGSDGRPNSTYVAADSTTDSTLNLPPPAAFKRASRKLSLSSPILGFGKREKKEKTYSHEKTAERHAKEREKEAKVRAKEDKIREKARQKEDSKKKEEEEEPALAPSAFPSFAIVGRV